MIGGRQRRGVGGQHLGGVLRRLEALQPPLAHGIGDDDRHAPLGSSGQRGEHARVVGAGIVADAEDGIGKVEVFQRDRAFTDADRLGQPHARRLVAHVGAVGEVVGAELAREQLVEERGLVGSAARAVEFAGVGVVKVAQHGTGPRESLVPAYRHEVVGIGIVAQRFGEAAGVFQPVVAPGPQLADAVLREEFWIDALDGRFPGHRLGAVLAELEGRGMLGVGPGATGAVEPVRLVHLEQRAGVRAGLHLLAHGARHRAQRTPTPGGARVVADALGSAVGGVIFGHKPVLLRLFA